MIVGIDLNNIINGLITQSLQQSMLETPATDFILILIF
jgi:hypothetical protein